MSLKKVIISGGGTGGHIFPALSIANEIKNRYPGVEILFVGALGRMEMERVPAAGYKIVGLPVMGFPRKPSLKMFTFFVRLFASAKMAQKVVKQFKPQIAIGVGGYASGPLLRAAAKRKIPTLIQEQNSYAGITNKLLGKKVDSVCVAYDNMERFFPAHKIVFTGNPVRANLINNPNKTNEALDYFKIKNDKKVLLIIGGSLGARSVNNAVLQNLKIIAESNIEVIWQTGGYYFKQIEQELEQFKPENLQIHKFITRMDLAYSVADIIVSRAGAGTISELCLIAKPCVLVPSPNVSEDHQTKNAMALVEKNAAVLVPDNQIKSKLFETVFELADDTTKCKLLSENIKKLARPNAANTIVDEVEKLVKL